MSVEDDTIYRGRGCLAEERNTKLASCSICKEAH